MTRRERVVSAITHHETDFLPYNISLTNQAWENTAKYLGTENFMDDIGDHIVSVYYSGEPVEIKTGYFKDDFGVVWNRTGADKDIGVIDKIIINEPDLHGFSFPQVPEEKLRRLCDKTLENANDRFTAACIGFSLFERAWTLTGMENLLVYMLTEPEFTHELFNAITEYNMKILKIYLEYDFDCIHFGDDWGQQKGLIMGPALWREYIKPYLKKMYDMAKSAGKFVSQHSCGDIIEVFPDLTVLGLDIYQTFQPEIYDIEAVKNKFGNSLSFWGGISTQRLLPFETPERVVEESRRIMSIMGKNGGYIVAPTHSVPGDVPPENIVALIKLFQNQ